MDQVMSRRLVQLFDGQSERGLGGLGVGTSRGNSASLDDGFQAGASRTVPQTADFGLPHRLLSARRIRHFGLLLISKRVGTRPRGRRGLPVGRIRESIRPGLFFPANLARSGTAKFAVQTFQCGRSPVARHHGANPDFTGINELDVNSRFGQRAEHLFPNPRVRPQADPND
jgi:hypothetical protein